MKLEKERQRKRVGKAMDLVQKPERDSELSFEPLTDIPKQVWSEVDDLVVDSIHSKERQDFNFTILGDLCWINPEIRIKIFQNQEFSTAWEEYVKRSVDRVLTYRIDQKLEFFGSSFSRWTLLDPSVRRFFPQISPDEVIKLLEAWKEKFQRNVGALFSDLSLLRGLQQSFPYIQASIRKLLEQGGIKQETERRTKAQAIPPHTDSALFNIVEAGLLYPEEAERLKQLMPQDKLEEELNSIKKLSRTTKYGLFIPVTLFFSQKAWVDGEGTLHRKEKSKQFNQQADLPQRSLVA